MPWYEGQTILEHLKLEPADVYEKEKHVFQFKQLSDQNQSTDFRGYAGTIRNNIKVGDAVTVLPSLTESKVTNIPSINNLTKLQ
jgi:sulfate adenylyltransferase subunit 1